MLFEFYNNYLKVTNYRQLKQLNNDLIEVDNLLITGTDLKILRIDKEVIVVKGIILNLKLG